MSLDILSYLMGKGSGGALQVVSKNAWDAMSADEKHEYGMVAVIGSSTGYVRGVVYSGVDYGPKAIAETTTYCRISTAVGDGASFNGRYFTRTSNEPVVFCGYAGTNGSNSYCVISKSATAPAETHNSYGELVAAGSIEINNTTLYLYVMSGQWNIALTNIVYTYEAESLHFTTDAYIKAGSPATVEGSSAAEFIALLQGYTEM